MKVIIAILLGFFAMSLFTVQANDEKMTPKEAEIFLQGLLKKMVKKGEFEMMFERVAPKTTKMVKKVTGVIEKAQLASSVVWDLIQLGLKNNERQFATEFARRTLKYVTDVTYTKEDFPEGFSNKMSFLISEAEIQTVLYELGKNTYRAFYDIGYSDKEKALQAGEKIENFGPLSIGIGGTVERRYKKSIQEHNMP